MKNIQLKLFEIIKTIQDKQSERIIKTRQFFATNWIWFVIIWILIWGIYIANSSKKEEKALIEYKRNVIEMQQRMWENEKTIQKLGDENNGMDEKTKCLINQIERIIQNKEIKEGFCDSIKSSWFGEIENKEVSLVKKSEKKREDKAKKNCYDKKANLNLSWTKLQDFCENPYRLNEFDTPNTQKGVSFSKKLYRKGWKESDERNKYINFVLEKGWKDWMDMVLTFTGENGNWNKTLRSYQKGKNWYYDYWFCQMNLRYHKDFIGNPQNFSKDFLDPYKQLERCIWIYKDGIKKWRIKTTFYAYKTRWKHEKLYYWK